MQPLRGAKVTTKNETLVKSYVNNGEKPVNSLGKENQKKRLHNWFLKKERILQI